MAEIGIQDVTSTEPSQLRLGFLTAIHVDGRGYVAGLLVTNRYGRPLEFQCTTPVKPNRTQQLLYGPTLVPFILGELIGRTLVDKIGVKPHLILTDRNEMLELRDHVSIPVACLNAATPETPAARTLPESDRLSGSPSTPATDSQNEAISKTEFPLGRQLFRIHSAHTTDLGILRNNAAAISPDADLQEPLERVRNALHETMSVDSGVVR